MRFVLKEDKTETIGYRVGRLTVIAELYLAELHRGNTESDGMRRGLYTSLDSDIRMVHTEDHIASCVYVDVDGLDIDSLIPLIREYLDPWTPDEILESWTGAVSGADKISAIFRIGVTCPDLPDERWHAAFLNALSDPDAGVRLAALGAMGYCEWPELNADFERVIREESDAACRERAKRTLKIRRKILG